MPWACAVALNLNERHGPNLGGRPSVGPSKCKNSHKCKTSHICEKHWSHVKKTTTKVKQIVGISFHIFLVNIVTFLVIF